MGFQVVDWIKHNSERLRLDLEERLMSHPGELGTARESVFREFLAKNLPGRFGVDTGFVFDLQGNTSKQIDIILFDKEVCPKFDSAGDKKFFPCEAVVAVGEMKSSLNSQKELLSALSNVRSVKELDRSANGSAIDPRSGECLDNKVDHLHQIFTFVFSIKTSLTHYQATQTLFEENFNHARHLWPNMIFCFDKYLLTYECEHGHCPNPMDALAISCFDEILKGRVANDFFVDTNKSDYSHSDCISKLQRAIQRK